MKKISNRGDRKGRSSDRGVDNSLDISDALLWSNCPEELYLQRVLGEQIGETDQEGIGAIGAESNVGDGMGQNMMIARNIPGRVHQWTDWAPVAGSAPIESGVSAAGTPVSVIEPIEIDFNDEATSVATNVSIPDFVQLERSQRAIEMDRAGMSTLSGDTALQRIPEMIVEVDGSNTIEMGKTGVSSLSTSTGIQEIHPQLAYTHLWIPAEDVTYARPRASRYEDAGKAPSTPSTRQSSTAFGRGTGESQAEGGCCGFLRRATEDRLFRSVVNIAACLLVVFVALSAAAMIKSTMFSDASGDQGFAAGGEQIRPPAQTATSAPTTAIQNADTASPSAEYQVFPTTPSPPPAVLVPTIQNKPTSAPTGSSAPMDTTTSHPAMPPSGVPAGSPGSALPPAPGNDDDALTTAVRHHLLAIIADASPDAIDSLGENSSPQYQAFTWLVADVLQRPLPDSRILQRWVLAVMFFGMDGGQWTRSDGWMTNLDECQWFTTSPSEICDSVGSITRIDLKDNNLGGILPEELALLSNSLVRLFLNSNERIAGTLPKSFSLLSNLERLHLTVNRIDGSIPPEFGAMTNLEHLALGRNDISGMLPTSLSNLRKLRLLDLALNSIVGTIPSELGDMTSLIRASFTSNQLSGTVPSELARLTQLSELKIGNNLLTGTIASEICAIETLRLLEASCEAISCSCCRNCG